MTARLRVGVLGLHHDHVRQNLAAVASGEVGRLVAAATPWMVSGAVDLVTAPLQLLFFSVVGMH
jgi:hypothetical protein